MPIAEMDQVSPWLGKSVPRTHPLLRGLPRQIQWTVLLLGWGAIVAVFGVAYWFAEDALFLWLGLAWFVVAVVWMDQESKRPILLPPPHRLLALWLLHEQYADRARRQAESDLYGETGGAVGRAIEAMEQVIAEMPTEDYGSTLWFQLLQDALRERGDRFREDDSDEDGFGIATFHETVRRCELLL